MRLLDIEAVCEMTGRTPQALYVERHRGHGIGSLGVMVGRRLKWRESDIDRWFDDRLEEQRREREALAS